MKPSSAPEPFANLAEAAKYVLNHLQTQTHMALWMITRTIADDWIVLYVTDQTYGIHAGDVFRWSESFCSRMVRGEGPQIAPDASIIPAYVSAPIAHQLPIGAYIGVPLLRSDGTLFGTLCAIDPSSQPQQLSDWFPSIELYARLLATILRDELHQQAVDRQLERAQNEAHTDALTMLMNRRGWDDHFIREEGRCVRYGTPAGVIMIDLDNLKAINDQYGHAAGDQQIIMAAQLLRQLVRSTDIVARLGGDEFAVLVVDSLEDALQSLKQRIEYVFAKNNIAASVGFAIRPPHANLTVALAQADEHMYAVKRQHKAAAQKQTSPDYNSTIELR